VDSGFDGEPGRTGFCGVRDSRGLGGSGSGIVTGGGVGSCGLAFTVYGEITGAYTEVMMSSTFITGSYLTGAI
jgi:hypothetical protein